jgi:hypothetical protein
MHTYTVQTTFTFGDRVRFESKTQRCSGCGRVYAITLNDYGTIDYVIDLDDESPLQPGILENELLLLSATKTKASHTLVVRVRFQFGDLVIVDSLPQGCKGRGKVVGIQVARTGIFAYLVDVLDGNIQGGVLEQELSHDC